MRLTYSAIKNSFLDNIRYSGSSDSTIGSFFDRELGPVYQMVLSYLDSYVVKDTKTATTVADRQYYHNPAGVTQIENATVTVGSIAYPLTVVDSQASWDRINEILISSTAIPQLFFPRRDDFGIWPIPQDAYTITLNYNLRDRNLLTADYTTGTVTVTNASQTVTGAGGATFTSAMIGRWFSTDTDGYWYRISAVPTSSTLTLETSFEGTGAAGESYTIGESPEIPEEGHILLSHGVTARYFAGPRGDITTGNWWDNLFWTGSGTNSSRSTRDADGGLIGLKKNYSSRSDSRTVYRRRGRRGGDNDRLWGTTIS